MPRIRKLTTYTLVALGSIALVLSIVYSSTILAFIGLGLTFWGALLLYIAPKKHVKQALLDHTAISSLANLNQILTELKYAGKPIYLPPRYFKEFDTIKIFIPKTKDTVLPTPEKIQQEEDKTFLQNPQGALIIPPGLSLTQLFEETMGTSFTKVDLNYLQQNLPKLFIEDLEIADKIEMQMNRDTVKVKIVNSVYSDFYQRSDKLLHMWRTMGCPLVSAVACALAKSSGAPVTIESVKRTNDGKTVEVHYRNVEAS